MLQNFLSCVQLHPDILLKLHLTAVLEYIELVSHQKAPEPVQ